MGADRLIDILERDVVSIEPAGRERAAIGEDRRDFHADDREQHAGNRLGATGDAEEAVIALRADDELDRVGDPVARDE